MPGSLRRLLRRRAGRGRGWAKSILFNERVRDEFATFFHRPQTLALGVCNGCQMMSNLRELIPAATCGRALCATSLTALKRALAGGSDAKPIPAAGRHGWLTDADCGLPRRRSGGSARQRIWLSLRAGLVALRFVDNFGKVTETYPANPNGSPNGITAVTSESGRATIMMPHPERVFRTVSNSGTRRTGARIARGCVSSVTRVNSWVNLPAALHANISPLPDRGFYL